MRRFLFLVVGITAAAGALVVVACGSSSTSERPNGEDASIRNKDGGPVDPADAGAYDAPAPQGPEPSCGAYCDLVMGSCKDQHAQYASREQCIEVCGRLTLGDAGDDHSDTVACRQHYAGSPALTDALTYCLAAGPFGGALCGDRCPVFCSLAIGACSPDAGTAGKTAPYANYPDCQTACTGYAYKDGGADGGGEPPNGPESGNTLNCRLFHLRAAIHDGSGCASIGADSSTCR